MGAVLEVLICAADAVADGGKGVRFPVLAGGEATTGFVVRHGGKAYDAFHGPDLWFCWEKCVQERPGQRDADGRFRARAPVRGRVGWWRRSAQPSRK